MEFIHEQRPPSEWTRRLRDFSPVSESMGFLECVWEPGDPWQPVQRWYLYEMLHPSIVHPDELEQLRGPHPRSSGHACTSVPISSWVVKPAKDYQPCLCRAKTESWRKGPCPDITLTQWNLTRRMREEYGVEYVGRPFWIIQGGHGGHKLGFTHEEQRMLEAEGVPTSTPDPGTLRYAALDERVIRKITRFNRLWQFANNADEYRHAMGEGYEQYRKEIEKKLRTQLVAMLKEHALDDAEYFIKAADAGEMDKLPKTDIDYEQLDELNDQRYIETGQMASPLSLLK